MAETNELVERLSTAAAIIMEDSSPAALTPFPEADDSVETRLSELDRACQDASLLVRAAQILARRGIR